MSIEIRNRKSLLIVDDDTSLRQMLCWTFDDMGYFTWGVGDSASAIDAVKGLSFAFALVSVAAALRIEDGRIADARLAQGETFTLRAFHDFLWKNGNVPLSLQRWELLGDRSEIDAALAPR